MCYLFNDVLEGCQNEWSPKNNTTLILPIYFFRYNVAILLITYIIPIIIISISTAHMSIVLWWRQPATSINTPQLERAKRKKQKVSM